MLLRATGHSAQRRCVMCGSSLHVLIMQRQSKSQFQRGVMKIDLISAFGQLRDSLGQDAVGLEDHEVQAMAIDTDVED